MDWKNTNKITKSKVLKVKGKQSVDLRNFTLGIPWSDSQCLLSNTNFSTKNGMYSFHSVVEKENNNIFKTYVAGNQFKTLFATEHHIAHGGSKSTNSFIKNISIPNEILDGTVSLSVNLDFINGTKFTTFSGFPIWSSIYINGELLARCKDRDREIDTGSGNNPSNQYRYSAIIDFTWNTPSVFKKVLGKNPFIGVLKEGLKNLEIKVVFDKKSDSDYFFPYSTVDLGGGALYSRSDLYCTYNVDVSDGDDILDTTSTAFFYEQGGK